MHTSFYCLCFGFILLFLVRTSNGNNHCATYLHSCALYDIKYAHESHQLTCIGDIAEKWNTYSALCGCSFLGIWCPTSEEACVKQKAYEKITACQLSLNNDKDPTHSTIMEEMYRHGKALHQDCLPGSLAVRRIGQTTFTAAQSQWKDVYLQVCLRRTLSCQKLDRDTFSDCIHNAMKVEVESKSANTTITKLISAAEWRKYYSEKLRALGLPSPAAAIPGNNAPDNNVGHDNAAENSIRSDNADGDARPEL